MRHISPVLWLMLALMLFSGCTRYDNRIREAVDGQLELYPESTLQDIYKSFFQDRYGPGHLIRDTKSARQYYEYELDNMVSRGYYKAEPCGFGDRFYRVSLDMVKDGLIDKESFFNAFINSAGQFRIPDLADWEKEWMEIVAVVEKMNVNLPAYLEQKYALAEMLRRGDYVVHHSERFNLLYDPHYRIMSIKNWNELKKTMKLKTLD